MPGLPWKAGCTWLDDLDSLQEVLPSLQAEKEAGATDVAALSKENIAAQANTSKLRKATDILTWTVLNEEAEGAGTAKLLKAALANVEVNLCPHVGILISK